MVMIVEVPGSIACDMVSMTATLKPEIEGYICCVYSVLCSAQCNVLCEKVCTVLFVTYLGIRNTKE